jgi:hypothetical protein
VRRHRQAHVGEGRVKRPGPRRAAPPAQPLARRFYQEPVVSAVVANLDGGLGLDAAAKQPAARRSGCEPEPGDVHEIAVKLILAHSGVPPTSMRRDGGGNDELPAFVHRVVRVEALNGVTAGTNGSS